MSQKAVAQPTNGKAKAPEAVPVVDKIESATAQPGSSEPKKRVAAKKAAAKPKTSKAAAAEKTVPTPKAPAKSVKKAAPVAKSKIVDAPKAEKPVKTKNPKLVRDSFTLPEGDYSLFATLKQRALAAGIEIKKSELLRASLTLLASLEDAAFAKTIGQVERIKTGRPKK